MAAVMATKHSKCCVKVKPKCPTIDCELLFEKEKGPDSLIIGFSWPRGTHANLTLRAENDFRPRGLETAAAPK